MVTVKSAIVTIGIYVIGRLRVEQNLGEGSVQPYFSSRESLSKGSEGE